MAHRRPAVIAAAALVLGLAACSSSGGGGSFPSTTAPTTAGSSTTAGPSTSVASTDDTTPSTLGTSSTSTTTAPARPLGKGDWDGTHWDAGNVVGVEQAGDGTVTLTFDRYQLYQEDGSLGEGKTLTSEPLVYANTDFPYKNDSTKLRTYVVAPDAQWVAISNRHEICQQQMDGQTADGPTFDPVDVASLISSTPAGDVAGPGMEAQGQDALTFNSTGQVVRVVFSGGC